MNLASAWDPSQKSASTGSITPMDGAIGTEEKHPPYARVTVAFWAAKIKCGIFLGWTNEYLGRVSSVGSC